MEGGSGSGRRRHFNRTRCEPFRIPLTAVLRTDGRELVTETEETVRR